MRAFFLAAALTAVAPAVAEADSLPQSTLSGQVTDTAGSPLAQVRVSVLEAERSTTTDLEGRYTISDLPTGTYAVSFALVGYAPQVRRVSLRDATLTLDVQLRATLIELQELQVTASPLATTSLTSPQPTSVLSSEQLLENRAASLGETVSSLPGVRSLSTGSGIGKPVIRGLTSNRVLVLADGQRLENQQWGDEHGPQVETGEAERIEVIRGPASVLYGSDALGGVINVVTRALPDAIGRDPFVGGDVIASYATNNRQPDGTVSLEGASGGVGFRGAFSGRTSDDVRTPAGELFNSGGRTWNGSGGIGYRGSWGSVAGSYTHRDERVEIHEDPAEDPAATPFQRVGGDRAQLTANLPIGSTHLDVDLGYERNRRREFEAEGASEIALGLLARTYSADLRVHHPIVAGLAGIIGASVLHNTFEKFGEETLIPDHQYDNLAFYAFEQAETGPWSFSFGARYDHRRLDVEDDTTLGVVAQRRTYNSLTGNLGVLYRVAEPVALVLNVGRGYRSPSAFDLFSNGVHEGTLRFERGDSTLENETSLNSDLAVRVQAQSVTAELGVFANFIENYIYPDPTGSIDPESGLQIYDLTQGTARLTGVEAVVEYHPAPFLHLRGTGDYTRGQNRTTDTPLPFVAPFRATYSVRFEGGEYGRVLGPYLSIGGESNARQSRTDPEDYAPPGYTLANVGAGASLDLGGRLLSLDLQLRNVFDKAYANFLSRYKTYALDPGRNFIARVSTSF
ncbi:MAG TPA: TonB-dependent receptor [Gemmatimonadales bacterium]|jgi:iron complex outermembrane receptor protein|nr:TonB-dependent receptor [Gemmatimonadales bacterium]